MLCPGLLCCARLGARGGGGADFRFRESIGSAGPYIVGRWVGERARGHCSRPNALVACPMRRQLVRGILCNGQWHSEGCQGFEGGGCGLVGGMLACSRLSWGPLGQSEGRRAAEAWIWQTQAGAKCVGCFLAVPEDPWKFAGLS